MKAINEQAAMTSMARAIRRLENTQDRLRKLERKEHRRLHYRGPGLMYGTFKDPKGVR